jgi:mutator family transposase
MRRAIDPSAARLVIDTASELVCPHCEGALSICEHRERFIFRLDGLVHHLCRDKSCSDKQCPGYGTKYRPLVDLRWALPRKSFGLDVVMAVGEGHLGQGRSLSELGRELTGRGVPIHQTHVGRLLRDFLALCKMARGAERPVREQLRKQGGIVLMVDGVQFDDRSPVLYLCWDARSGSPLFGERVEERDTDGLSRLLGRVKQMGVEVLGVVTDAEKGLVPAVHKVFPGVPHQLCQTHFLKNCAKPMDKDLRELGHSVTQRAEKVRKLQKRLSKVLPSPPKGAGVPAEQAADGSSRQGERTVPGEAMRSPARARPLASAPGAEPLTEVELVKQMCAMGRLGARATGKAPLCPPELVRHQRLEEVRGMAQEAAQKKASPRRG